MELLLLSEAYKIIHSSDSDHTSGYFDWLQVQSPAERLICTLICLLVCVLACIGENH